MAQKLTTCTFCGTGCGLYLEMSGGRLVGAYPSLSHPTNAGRLCVRGWHVHEVASAPDRIRTPLLRKGDSFREATWDDALAFIAEKLLPLRSRYGPDAIAFLSSPRASNEETYLLQKFARTVIGTNNVDHGTGVFSHTSVDVLGEMLGISATTNPLSDLAKSDVIVVDGVDLARRVPVVGGAVVRAKVAGAKLIVIGSRSHRVARQADYFLQIMPGTEPMLYGALAKVIVDRGLMDTAFIKQHCRDYDAFLREIRLYDVLEAAEGCGVSPQDIEEAAQAFARAQRGALVYSTGIEARPRDDIRGLVNLALLTGNVGKPGAGIFAVTEHNNMQGACDVGMLPDRLPGYRALADEHARGEVEAAWHAKLPAKPGVDAHSMLTRDGGHLKALWLCRSDPVNTGFLGDTRSVLATYEFIVLQYLFMSASAQYAHVILPITAFGEEQVTFTSCDRRIQLAEKAVEPQPGPIPAWQQIVAVANKFGANWNYQSSADVLDEIARVVPFYSGVSYANLAADFGRQWPCTREHPLGTSVLFANGNGHSLRFAPVPKPFVVPPPPQFPLVLVFGQSLYYWHQSALVQHSESLRREHRILLMDYPNGFVEIHPDDAKPLNIRDGQKVRLVSPDASATTTARVTEEVRRGTVCVPYFVREIEREILGGPAEGGALVWIRIEKEAA